MMNKSGQGSIADTLTNKLQFVEHNVACKIFAKLLLIVNLLSNK